MKPRISMSALALLILSTAVGGRATAQERPVQRIAPGAAQPVVVPRAPAPLTSRARLRYLETMVAARGLGESSPGFQTLRNRVASNAPALAAILSDADVRLSARSPYSGPPLRAYLGYLDASRVTTYEDVAPEGYVVGPAVGLLVTLRPASPGPELYMVDYAVHVPANAPAGPFVATATGCQINFKSTDEWEVGPGSHHLLGVVQTQGPSPDCVLKLTGFGRTRIFYTWEATRIE